MKNRTQELVGSLIARVGSLLRGLVLVCLAACALVPLSADAATTNIVLRLDASRCTSAGTISTWGDTSGNGHDATAAGDPEVVLNVQNGLPVVRFDGSDRMKINHTYITGSAFIVAKYDGTTFDDHDGLYGAATGYGGAEQYWGGGLNGSTWGNEPAGGFYNSKYLNGSLSHTALTDPAAFNLYSGVDSTPASFDSWALGVDRGWTTSRRWDGDIAEVIVYDDALSDFDRKGVEVYLDEKWGLNKNLRSSYGSGNFNADLDSLGLAPTELTMVMRLDASKLTTAGDISTWADTSGNGYDATASSDPAVVLNAQNSLSVVRFDGNDYFTIPDTYVTGTAIAVAKYNNTTFNGWDGLYTGDGSAGSEIYWSGHNGTANLWGETSLTDRYFNGNLSSTGLSDPSAFNLYSGVDSSPQSLTGYNVGADRSSTFAGSRAWEGDIAEIIVYQEALSAYDRKGVEVYLDEKWGLGLNLRTTYGPASFNEDPYALGLESPTMVLRLDASILGATSDLETWVDRSGNGHHATHNGDPAVVLNGQNGLPVISLDGNDCFTVAHSYITGTAFAIAKYGDTVFPTGGSSEGFYGAATGLGALEQYWTGSGLSTSWSDEYRGQFQNLKYFNGALSRQALTDPSKFHLYSGVDPTPTSFASWAVGCDRGFGAARAWTGDIGEFIVYEEALTDFDRKGVEVYLDEKWGLGLNLRSTYGAGNFNDDTDALGLAPGATLFLFR